MTLWQTSWDLAGFLAVWGVVGDEKPALADESHLNGLFEAIEFPPDRYDSLNLQLPTIDGQLQLGSRFSAEESHLSRNDQTRAIFETQCGIFGPLTAVSFLTSLPNPAPRGQIFDDSVQYWLEATKFVLELLTRGRYLPSIQSTDAGYRSQWHPIISAEDDLRRLATLVDGMPHVARASAHVSGATVLETFINGTIDALNRSFLAREPFLASDRFNPRNTGQIVSLNWARSLSSAAAEIDGPLFELAQLEQRVRRWNRTAAARTPTQLSTRLQLVPPGADEEPPIWKLEFSFETKTSPRQTLSFSRLWHAELGFLVFSEREVDELEDLALRDLAIAAGIFRPLRKALLAPFPSDLEMNTEEAYQFLNDAVEPLEEQGFTVDVPTWWRARKERQFGVHLNVAPVRAESGRTSREGFLGLNEIVNFSYDLTYSGEKLSEEELKQLLQQQAPLMKVRGEWVEIRRDGIEATIQILEQKRGERLRLIDALRLGYGADGTVVPVPIVGLSAEGWIQRLLDQAEAVVPSVEQPPSFIGELRPYQRGGLAWLVYLTELGCGGCLADDMGLGKTVQFLALLAYEREKYEDVLPTVLIVPMSILDNWEREAKRFAPNLKVYVHHGPQRAAGSEFMSAAERSDLVITTYSLAHRDEAILSNMAWGRIALDEAQNAKNLATKQARAIRRIVQAQLRSPRGTTCHRLALTGTPLENHLDELWSIFDFLNPGYLGTSGEFRASFTLPIERFRDSTATARLSRLIRPFVLRRLKTDREVIDDLPEKIEIDEFTGMTTEQGALYQQVLQDMLPQVDQSTGIKRKGLVLAAITRLKQICDHPALTLDPPGPIAGRSGKLDRLEELLETILAEGDKVLIFTQFAKMGILLRDHLQERFQRPVLLLHGQMPQRARAQAVDLFQKADGPPIFVLSLKVGGVGLNLTAATQVVHYDQWWNPAVQEQATDRAFRIGQKRNVQVRRFICRGTLEERIAELLSHKRELARTIVGEAKNSITQLGSEELRALLQLAAPPVDEPREDI